MATNDFLPFSVGSGANVLSQTDYAALAALGPGFSSGVAPSAACNKVWRQSSIMASVIAQLIVANTGQNATDDGTTATLLANLQAAVGGRLLGVTRMITSGTFTPNPLAKTTRVTGVGGGGGGGGISSATSTQFVAAGGGSAGSYGVVYFNAPLSGPITVTIGAGGSGGVAGPNNGGNGGNTTFGSLITFPGGIGGAAGGAAATSYIVAGGTTPVALTTTGTALVNKSGAPAVFGLALSTGYAIGGTGGDSPMGSAGKGGSGGIGSAASGYGAGGGGGGGGATVAASAGGNGSAGYILVEEFA